MRALRAAASGIEQELEETYRSITYLTNELERAREQLEHQSFHDSLTRLPNRKLFHDRLEQSVQLAARHNHFLPVFMMDLNRFKEVNDGLGHDAGDVLLREVANRLSAAVRGSDTIARLGGDEFAAVLPTTSSLEGAVAVAERFIRAIERPYAIKGQTVEVGASVGIAYCPDHGKNGEALMRCADDALYEAKNAGNGYEVFGSAEDQKLLRGALLASQLRQAIQNKELSIYHQPKVDMKSGRVTGVEALVRWHHPEHGFLAPAQFIPSAERTAAIKPLTLHVMRMALQQIAAWARSGLDLTVAVNLSARVLHDWELPGQVFALLDKSAVPPDRLVIEITETALMSGTERAFNVVKAFADRGFNISIDDFGTGYSSLNHLKNMPISEIKIDRSFVGNLVGNAKDFAIVRSVIDLCDHLEVTVVAEGVETGETWDTLLKLGCQSAQGYYITRPMPAKALPDWLRVWSRAPNPDSTATSDGMAGQSDGHVESRPLRALVVEDDEAVGELIRGFLASAGYEARVVSNGREGLEALSAKPTDLLITDIFMPEKDGIETIGEVRRSYPSVKILAISAGLGKGSLDLLAYARKLGAHQTLRKPFKREELLEVLDAVTMDDTDEVEPSAGGERSDEAPPVRPDHRPGDCHAE